MAKLETLMKELEQLQAAGVDDIQSLEKVKFCRPHVVDDTLDLTVMTESISSTTMMRGPKRCAQLYLESSQLISVTHRESNYHSSTALSAMRGKLQKPTSSSWTSSWEGIMTLVFVE